jgi:hypothetical protein
VCGEWGGVCCGCAGEMLGWAGVGVDGAIEEAE